MKVVTFLACVLPALCQSLPMGAVPSPRGPGFSIIYSVAVDRTKMGSSTLSNFPVEVSVTGTAAFKATGNGGSVTNASGYDIIVATDTTCSTLIPWEVEFWDGTSGAWVAWAKLTSVNGSAATSNTTFAVCVGKPSITTRQNTGSYASTAVWDANYLAVYHFGAGPSMSDSTSNGANLTAYSLTATTGQIDGGLGVASSAYAAGPSTLSSTTGITMSMWIKTSYSGGSQQDAIEAKDTSTNTFVLGTDTSGRAFFVYGYPSFGTGGTTYISSSSTINDGSWHYICGTESSVDNKIHIFLDGSDVNSAVQNDLSWVWNNYFAVNSTTGSPLNGSADEVRISNRYRTADWILSEYNNQKNPGNVGAANFLVWGQQ